MVPLQKKFLDLMIVGMICVVIIFSYSVLASNGETIMGGEIPLKVQAATEPLPSADTKGQPAVFPINTPVADHRLEMFFLADRSDSSLELDQPLIIKFSQPVDPAFFKFEVTPEKGKWTARWSPDFSQVTLVPDSPLEPEQTLWLKADVVGGPSIERTVHVRRLTPIRQLAYDLKIGRIDINQAARYRVFSLFKPSEVPESYRLTSAMASGTPILKKVQKDFELLDEATRQELQPYFLSPLNPKSFWHTKLQESTPSSHSGLPFSLILRAWAEESPSLVEEVYTTENGYDLVILGLQSDAGKVRLAHHLIETERIYERFKELLGEDVHITSNNKIFIFIFNNLIEPSDDLEEEPYGFFFNDSTTGEPIIFISASLCQQENVLGATLAHELFHAFQTSFAKYSATWLEESTAVWAEDYINKAWNTEQDYIDDAFEYEMARSEQLETDSDEGVYGVYLFPYYLTNVNPKTSSVMRSIWENRGNGDSEIDAVQNAIGDFDDVWKKYSLATLDVEPEDGLFPDMVVPSYGGNDPLPLFASHGTQTLVIENQGIAYPGLVDLEGIQTAYFEVKNKNQGADAPAIRFDLTPFQKHSDKVSVQAIIYYRDGRKEYEDWTGRDERLFCLGIDSQNFSVVYIAIGCSDSDLTLIEPLVITPEPTSRCYSGTVTLTRQREERDNFEDNYRIGIFGTGNGSHHSSGNQSATLRLELDLSERILPQQEALLDQMQARAKDVKPDQMEAVRGFMENIMKTPQASLDKETGLMKVRYLVKNCRIDSAGGTYRSYNQYESADPNGMVSEDEGSCNIQWSAKGLSAQTSEAIERGHIRVDIYYEPETGQIRWVYIPQLDIDTQVTENCNGQEIRRSGNGYESFPHSTNDSRDEVFQVTPSNGGNASEGLPMNVVWQAKQGDELTASGGERIETPIDRTWSSDGNSGTGEKMIIETFEWSINLTRAN